MKGRFPAWAFCVAALLPFCLTAIAFAQIGFGASRRGAEPILPNIPYDGKFTFVRLRYGPMTAYAAQRIPWSHDYPLGERNFMKIMNEVSYLAPHVEETNILSLSDPELCKYPLVYMAEPGYLTLTDEEIQGFRAYLLKGGFVIFDDFAANRGGMAYFESEMRRVLPNSRWFELDGTHPIFHAFFEIDDPLKFLPPYDRDLPPVYYGLFQDNDPSKRLMAIANYNNDISEYWEFSDTGSVPIDESNEAYKLGVNYIIYGMTH